MPLPAPRRYSRCSIRRPLHNLRPSYCALGITATVFFRLVSDTVGATAASPSRTYRYAHQPSRGAAAFAVPPASIFANTRRSGSFVGQHFGPSVPSPSASPVLASSSYSPMSPSSRLSASSKATNDDAAASDPEPTDVAAASLPPPKKRKAAAAAKTPSPKKASSKKTKTKKSEEKASPTKKKAAAKKASPSKKKTAAKKSDSGDEAKPKKKTKKADHQRLTERDILPKLWADDALRNDGSYTFRVMSWNVAGLRAVMRNHPTALADLASEHGLDVICLQETKLQESHVDDPKLKINGHLLNEEGYDSYYSCATAKKGYAGTAVFVKRRSAAAGGGGDGKKGKGKKQATLGAFLKGDGKEKGEKEGKKSGDSDSIGQVDVKNLIPLDVSYGLGKSKHDAEGRIITLDFPLFTLSNLYVPNSGQKLDRLDYRTEEWDGDLLSYMQQKESDRDRPVIWLGDLNVAHTAKETWNEGAKHLAKSAGTTQQERDSFQRQLDAGFVDAFRRLHPEAKGQYTYWSQRAGNREPNKGLRLDYFVCSESLMDDEADSKVVVRDSYMIHDQKGSDHCPIVLELEIKS